MSPEERDLSPLDPERDPVQWERMVGSIMASAQPELERRSAVLSPLLLLSDWFRPTMTATAAVALFAASVVLFLGDVQPEQAGDIRVVAEGIGIPSAIANWLDTGEPDALDELVFGMEGEAP